MVRLHGTAARFLIVVGSAYTACLQLFSSTSLAYRAAGDGWLIDVINIAVLIIAAVGAADLVWHDILRRGLIWPSFPMRQRHQACVAVYAMLAGAFGIRAFIVPGDSEIALQVGAYYVLFTAGIAIEAAAMAFEQREEQCPTDSDSA
jgi:hypothetical protein